MKLVVFGTKDFALPTFRAVIDAGHDVLALVTQPDRPQGRKQELIPSPIKVEAISRGVPVFQPDDVNTDESVAFLRGLAPELLVTAAYGQILSADLLGIAPLGGINLHGSILPRYRGAAPVARAIQNGEAQTGVTVIRMTPRIDAGGMISVVRTPIDPDETTEQLEARLAEIGAPLIVEAISSLSSGTATVLPQTKAKVTKAPKLSKDDAPIVWTRTARQVHDHVRALQPWPMAETTWHPSVDRKSPIRLIVHRTAVVDGEGPPGTVLLAESGRLIVAAGEGAVLLVSIQPPGKKPMPAADFLRGHRVMAGDRMTPP
jgi:methionyl-tRNA formyltransferase